MLSWRHDALFHEEEIWRNGSISKDVLLSRQSGIKYCLFTFCLNISIHNTMLRNGVESAQHFHIFTKTFCNFSQWSFRICGLPKIDIFLIKLRVSEVPWTSNKEYPYITHCRRLQCSRHVCCLNSRDGNICITRPTVLLAEGGIDYTIRLPIISMYGKLAAQ